MSSASRKLIVEHLTKRLDNQIYFKELIGNLNPNHEPELLRIINHNIDPEYD